MASIVQRNKSFSVVYTIYDGEELEGMTETFPDLFSPALLWAIQTGCLWKHRGPRVSTRSINPCTFRDRPV